MTRRPVRLTRQQAWLLLNMGAGWLPILYGRDDQRATDGLLRLKLVSSDSYPAAKGKAWGAEPTLLGLAMAALLARRTGSKLNRKGVQILAKHRARLVALFDVDGSVANLEAAIADRKANYHAQDRRRAAQMKGVAIG